MTPAGQNYPIAEHSFLFWGVHLGAIVAMTVAILGLFLIMVHRHSRATRAAIQPQAVALPPASELPARQTSHAA